jgi:putative membrane protein
VRPEVSRTADRVVLSVIAVVSAVALLALAALMLGRGPTPGVALNVSMLPTVNALLNTASAVLLTAGFVFIRRRNVAAHRACMLGAFAVSVAFLACYVVYHAYAGSRPFTGQGWIRPLYFVLLVSHIVLAAAIVPLALTTIYRGLSAFRGLAPQIDRHKRLARRTLPIWLYVSITGVIVYVLLYHW